MKKLLLILALAVITTGCKKESAGGSSGCEEIILKSKNGDQYMIVTKEYMYKVIKSDYYLYTLGDGYCGSSYLSKEVNVY